MTASNPNAHKLPACILMALLILTAALVLYHAHSLGAFAS